MRTIIVYQIYANVNSLKIKVSEVARLLPPEADIGHIVSEAPKVGGILFMYIYIFICVCVCVFGFIRNK